jgi:2-dehydro-3-deoxygalactonokinase
LFGIRAAKLLGVRDDADAASFASGLLIGAEIAARFADKPHQVIYLLADPTLGALYAAAIAAQGREARIIDSQAAFVAGILAIGNQT